MSNFFDSKGELNASSKNEAFQLITKLASLLEDNSPSNSALTSPGVSESKRDELISRAISTQEGKLALAQAMANPIN